MFMCDIATCEYKQKYLLYQIIFCDCRNAENWSNYIDFLWRKDEENRAKIRRLMTVALDCIDPSAHLNCEVYIQLRLRAIKDSR
jgi:hypothetical protein